MIVAVHSAGRQDWGILRPVCAAISARPGLQLCLIAGGMHARDGQKPHDLDGTPIAAWLDDLPRGDDDAAIAAAAARTSTALADQLPRLAADCLVLAGDRTETLAAATTAICLRLPVVHLHGGETTLGAIDDRCRHAISRLAALHAVAHPSFAQRLRLWGEPSDRIIVSGAPALDTLLHAQLPNADALANDLGRKLGKPLVLLTHHPATLGVDPRLEIAAVLAGLATALTNAPDAMVVATRPNTDVGGQAVQATLQAAAQRDKRIVMANDLGSLRWWGLMAHADCMLGNSSSGLLEAPSFALPVVNVGDRQRGRLRLDNIIDCPADATAIAAGISAALARSATQPRPRSAQATALGNGNAAATIVQAIAALAAMPPDQRMRKEVL
ncbi:MAG: UDP-N-acetylglucosamine 2-epimerase [Planctomycetota bacterium]